jgi:hypothetical protein
MTISSQRDARPKHWNPARALRTSSMLSERYRRMYDPSAMKIEPENVIKVLNRAGVKFVLMGTHGIGPWMKEPRGTRDVDLLVQKGHQRKAIRAVCEAYPALPVENFPAVTRFLDPADQTAVIDLMKPVEEIYRTALKTNTAGGKTHRIPTLEVALARKFGAMTSPNRSERKKHLDAADLIAMVEHQFDRIDRDVLFSLGEMIRDGGGPDILKLLDGIKAGRPISMT